MFTHLRSAVETRLSTAIDRVGFSTPTIGGLPPSTVNARLEQAGLNTLDGIHASLIAASAALVTMDDATHVLGKGFGPTILVLEYYPFTLVLSVVIEDAKISYPATLDEAAGSVTQHAHTFSTQRGYWKYVKQAIQRLPRGFSGRLVDVVIALGEEAANEKFVEAAAEAIDGLSTGMLRRPKMVYQNPVFSAARGAAIVGARARETAQNKRKKQSGRFAQIQEIYKSLTPPI